MRAAREVDFFLEHDDDVVGGSAPHRAQSPGPLSKFDRRNKHFSTAEHAVRVNCGENPDIYLLNS